MAIYLPNNNPLAPATAPSGDDVLNAYQDHAARVRAEFSAYQQQQQTTVPGFNPLNPMSEPDQQDAQQAHQSNIEQFLSPIPHNVYDADQSVNSDRAADIAKNLEHDEAFKEIEKPYIEYLESMRQGRLAGQIDEESFKTALGKWGLENLKPVFDKHHHKDSPTYKLPLHDTSWIKESK
ncbi:hypothetical protein K3712_000545 [Escherichia coli]|nr:hypothetical protein [Escherichia coli]